MSGCDDDEVPFRADAPSRLRDANGVYTMVAVDQRDSLRVMLAQAGTLPVTDEMMRDFKVAVARALSPVASAILVDADYGLGPILDCGALAEGCDVIVAVDAIQYGSSGGAMSTSLRTDLLTSLWDQRVAGLKYLLLWTPDRWLGCGERDVEEFVRASEEAGIECVLEVVVREPDGSLPSPERQALLLVEAAKHMARFRPTLYKTEVPFRNLSTAADVMRVSASVTESIGCPWVVLSSGVDVNAFPEAVYRTSRGGADGFLAGRAVWGMATSMDGAAATRYLSTQSVRTVERLRKSALAGRAASKGE